MLAANRVEETSEFFVAGGALSARAPSYVERCTDDELYQATLTGKYCYVLTPRQMGKSSLMVRTAHRLKQAGVKTAIIDLTKIGTNVTDEQWYLGLIARLNNELGLRHDYYTWWEERDHLGPVQRFTEYFPEVVLANIEAPVVIFIDEIDTTLRLGSFSDDFFAAVRAFRNNRATDADYDRLSFVFLGVATPAELIKDPNRTPFNIGKAIQLEEFTREEASVLEQGLMAVAPTNYSDIFDQIYSWTSGHPYLTQQLCLVVADAGNRNWSVGDVDRIVDETFLSDDAKDDKNIRFIKDRIQSHPRKTSLVSLYGRVYRGRHVKEDIRSIDQSLLQTFGLLKVVDGSLAIRNRIYRSAFGSSWIRQNTDINWYMFATGIMGLLLIVLLGMYVRDRQLPNRADDIELAYLNARTSPTRVAAVVDMLAIDPWILSSQEYEDRGIDLFYGMNHWEEQSGVFRKNEADQSDSDEALEERIRDVYFMLADVNENDGSTFLLRIMLESLSGMKNQTEGRQQLAAEIDEWILARESLRTDDMEQAFKHMNTAVEKNDQNPSTLFERGRIYASMGNYEPALSDFEGVLAISPGEAETEEISASETPTQTPTSTATPRATETIIPSAVEAVATPGSFAEGSATTGPEEQPVLPTATPRPFQVQFRTRRDRADAIEKYINTNGDLAVILSGSGLKMYPILSGQLQIVAPEVFPDTPTPTTALVMTPTAPSGTSTSVPPLATPTEVPQQTPTGGAGETPPPALSPEPMTMVECLPDLVVSEIWIENDLIRYEDEPWTWIHFTVENIGACSTRDNSIFVAAWNDYSPIPGYSTLDGPIEAGGSVNSSFAVGQSDIWPPGFYRLTLEVDYDHEIAESDEDNNRSERVDFLVYQGGWVNTVTCGNEGVKFASYCWYLGAPSSSCDEVCASHGGYHEALRTFAGSDGYPETCEKLLWEMVGYLDDFVETTQNGLGCYAIIDQPATTGYWDSAPSTASARPTENNAQRVCACQE